MLRIENLQRRYEAETGQAGGGVFGISLDIRPGEFFTLLGPSGCGKTTTLRCVAGLERPDGGRIMLDGRAVFDAATGLAVAVHQRDIGMVFQSYAIWPHMSVFENVAYPLRVTRGIRIDRAGIEARAHKALEMVGLDSYGRRSATKLSGGQQQRLALARALVREPKLLLLDEPLSNLDAQLRVQMRAELKRIQAQRGVTTLYVTHDQSEAMAISDRIAVLHNGRVVQVGAPGEIYDRPRTVFVAGFVGQANLFHGRLEATGGGMGRMAIAGGMLFGHLAQPVMADDSACLMIRPEHVELLSTGQDNCFAGIVRSQTYLGEVADYAVALDGGLMLTVRARPGLAAEGEKVQVRLPPEHVIAVAPDEN